MGVSMGRGPGVVFLHGRHWAQSLLQGDSGTVPECSRGQRRLCRDPARGLEEGQSPGKARQVTTLLPPGRAGCLRR